MPTQWRIVALVTVVNIVAAFQIGKLPVSLPVIRQDVGLSLVAGAWIVSMFNVIGASAGIAAGTIADWLGHRRVIIVALACVAAASLLGGLSGAAPLLLMSRFIEGAGVIIIFAASPPFLLRVVNARDQRLALSVYTVYMSVGVGGMILLTPFLMALAGWPGLWLINGVLLALVLAVFAYATRVPDTPASAPGGIDLSGLWRGIGRTVTSPGPILLTLCFCMFSANYLVVLVFLPTFLIERMGVNTITAAAAIGTAALCTIMGNLTGAWLLHRHVPHWRLIAGASAMMGLLGFGIFQTEIAETARYALCAVFYLCGGLIPAAVTSAAPIYAPSPAHIGATMGFFTQGANLGHLAGAPTFAAFVSSSTWQAAPWMVVSIAGLGTMLALAFRGVAPREGAA